MSHLYNLESLKEWSGFDQEARVIAFLNEKGIRWYAGKGGQPCTTQAQIDASFGVLLEEVEFE